MKLWDFLSVLAADETVIIRDADDMIKYCGHNRMITNEMEENVLRSITVNRVFSGFGGLVVETSL